jgi:hypothetical protein
MTSFHRSVSHRRPLLLIVAHRPSSPRCLTLVTAHHLACLGHSYAVPHRHSSFEPLESSRARASILDRCLPEVTGALEALEAGLVRLHHQLD